MDVTDSKMVPVQVEYVRGHPVPLVDGPISGLAVKDVCQGQAPARALRSTRRFVRRYQLPWYDVRLGSRAHPIYCVPSFVNAAECDTLIASAERVVSSEQRQQQSRSALEKRVYRLPVATLGREAFRVCDAILHRVLDLLESRLAHVAVASFGEAFGLHRRLEFSLDEPAVNVYYPGGEFRPHEDLKQLTVFVPLSPDGSFTGGGTAFWSEHIDVEAGGDVERYQPTLVLRPPRGTAALWGGDITHAGQPVASGVRHIFVASFSLVRDVEAAEAA